MEGFRNAINYCGFKDLGFNEPDYSWCNMQEGDRTVYLRLDRALATCDWIDKFGEVKVHHLVDSTFDRYTLFISSLVAIKQPRSHCFHFEDIWTKREECSGIIESNWGSISDMNTLEGMASGLMLCAYELALWNSSTLGQLLKLIQMKRKKQDKDGSLGVEINKVRKEINEL